MTRREQLLKHLRYGDILNTDTRIKWYRNPFLWFVYNQIRAYQRRKWGKGALVGDIHTMIYLGNGRLFSFESPIAIFRSLILGQKVLESGVLNKYVKELKVNDNSRYRICRLKSSEYDYYRFSKEENDYIISNLMNTLIGRKYDYGQLLDILLKQLFRSFHLDKLRIFDLGRKRKVCSVAVHWVLVRWWKKFMRDKMIRPLGESQHIETTCPADFANHSSFGVVIEL